METPSHIFAACLPPEFLTEAEQLAANPVPYEDEDHMVLFAPTYWDAPVADVEVICPGKFTV